MATYQEQTARFGGVLDWPIILFFVLAYVIAWGAWHLPVLIGRDLLSIVAFSLLSIGLSLLFTWLFNGSGGSLIPVLLFHASQNWEEGFETLFPSLVGTEWELISTLSLLWLG